MTWFAVVNHVNDDSHESCTFCTLLSFLSLKFLPEPYPCHYYYYFLCSLWREGGFACKSCSRLFCFFFFFYFWLKMKSFSKINTWSMFFFVFLSFLFFLPGKQRITTLFSFLFITVFHERSLFCTSTRNFFNRKSSFSVFSLAKKGKKFFLKALLILSFVTKALWLKFKKKGEEGKV